MLSDPFYVVAKAKTHKVLILVVMEDALWLGAELLQNKVDL